MSDTEPIVPAGFIVPGGFVTDTYWLEPLESEHNDADLAAWTSSIAHIQATPGFAGRSWPVRVFTPEENAGDIDQHAADFRARTGFTYTVRSQADEDVIGCVYLYPPKRDGYDVDVRSWVRHDHADLDAVLHADMVRWIAASWPFTRPDYAAR